MTPRRIFIGSSNEAKRKAQYIARHLARDSRRHYKVLGWWNVFRGGDITIERLREVASSVDAAIFLCTPDDEGVYRKTNVKFPRANVMLEFGLFYTILGRYRTLVVKAAGAILPSDIHAITYIPVDKTLKKTANSIMEDLDSALQPLSSTPRAEHHTIVVDPRLSDCILKPPSEWHSRTRYFGSQGARNWLAVARDPEYKSQRRYPWAVGAVSSLLKNIPVRTFVSLGPGDGELDEEIVTYLRNKEPALSYIPVDISEGLLVRSAERISKNVTVPVSIWGDFESDLNFIVRQVKKHGSSPILFGLLGGTIGNLDEHENKFIRNLLPKMDEDTYFLLDLSFKGKQWCRNVDFRSDPARFSKKSQSFFSYGLSQHTGESAASIADQFQKRIRCRPGTSAVPRTEVFEFYDAVTNLVVASICRYDLKEFREWIEREFDLKVCHCVSHNSDDNAVGMAMLLISRSKSSKKRLR